MSLYPADDKQKEKEDYEIFFEKVREKKLKEGVRGHDVDKVINNYVGNIIGLGKHYFKMWDRDKEDEKYAFQIITNRVDNENVNIKNAIDQPMFSLSDLGYGKPGDIPTTPIEVATDNGKLPYVYTDARRKFWTKQLRKVRNYTGYDDFVPFIFNQKKSNELYQNRMTISYNAPTLRNKAFGTPNKYITMKRNIYEVKSAFTGIGLFFPHDALKGGKYEIKDSIAHQAYLVGTSFEQWRMFNVWNVMHNMEDPYIKHLRMNKAVKKNENVYEFNMRTRDKFFGIMQKKKDPIAYIINETKKILDACENNSKFVDDQKWALVVSEDIPFEHAYRDENRDYYKSGPNKIAFRNQAGVFNRKKAYDMVDGNRIYKVGPYNHEEFADGLRVNSRRDVIFRTNYFPNPCDAVATDGSYNIENMNIKVFSEKTGNMILLRFKDLLEKTASYTEPCIQKRFFGGENSAEFWKIVWRSYHTSDGARDEDRGDTDVKLFFERFVKALLVNGVKIATSEKITGDLFTTFHARRTANPKEFASFERYIKNILDTFDIDDPDYDQPTKSVTEDLEEKFKDAEIKIQDFIKTFTQHNLLLPFSGIILRNGEYVTDDALLAHKGIGVIGVGDYIPMERMDDTRILVLVDVQGMMNFSITNTKSGFRKIPHVHLRGIKKKCDKEGIFMITALCDDVTVEGAGNPFPLTGRYSQMYNHLLEENMVEHVDKDVISTYSSYGPLFREMLKRHGVMNVKKKRALQYMRKEVGMVPRSYIAKQEMFDPATGGLTKCIDDTGFFAGIDYKKLLKDK